MTMTLLRSKTIVVLLAAATLACSTGSSPGTHAPQPPRTHPGSAAPAEAVALRLDRAADAGSAAAHAPAPARAPATRVPYSVAAAPGEGVVAAMTAARHVIRTGSLTIEVEDAADAARRVEDVAMRHEGYVSALQGSTDPSGRRSATISIRVPPQRFMAALGALRDLGRVEIDSVSTQDVGREYADLESRLRAKHAVAARMEELLRGQAASLQELLHAEQQLAGVREQIEQIEGQRRYYDQQTALSTITATVHEESALVIAAAAPSRFLPVQEAAALAREHAIAVLAGVTYVLLTGGPWALLAVLVALVLRRRRRAVAAPVSAPAM